METLLDELLKLSEEVTLCKEINLQDIPCVDLYMDQVTTLFEDRLSHLKRDSKENILTKTMINNYAKAKILTPVKNKKYNRQQMIMLILIYHLKQILSLEDIGFLFNNLVKELGSGNISSTFVDSLYEKFISIKREEHDEFASYLEKSFEGISANSIDPNTDDSNFSELLLVVLTLINSAITQKRMAEKIIDAYFKKKEQ